MKKLIKKYACLFLCTLIATTSISNNAFANETKNETTVVTQEINNQTTIEQIANYEHTYEVDYTSDNIGYYNYKIKIQFNKDSSGKFTECKAYIYTKMNTLAVANPNYVINCEISNATHSISNDGSKITIKFNMNYTYAPLIYGQGWTEQKTFVLHDYDV